MTVDPATGALNPVGGILPGVEFIATGVSALDAATDRLFFTGGEMTDPSHLLVVDMQTGAILADPPLPESERLDTLEFDPDGGEPDFDGDGVPDGSDNCPDHPNPDQTDTDDDGLGDACDPSPFPCGEDLDVDSDGDCFKDFIETILRSDPQELRSTPEHSTLPETCANGVDDDWDGDTDDADPGCQELDSDGDTVADSRDNCSGVLNPDQADMDGDGRGDVCDSDTDGDGCLNGIEQILGTDPEDDADKPPWC